MHSVLNNKFPASGFACTVFMIHNSHFIMFSGSSSVQRDSLPSSPRETTPFEPFESDSSSESSPYEDFHEQLEFQSLKGD